MSRRTFVDDYLHLGARRRLVQTLRARGITDEEVLGAVASVPRHWFVAPAYEAHAYEDKALPILQGQTISQPYTVAYQSSLLEVQPRTKVLEVGTGSGYQAAVLGKLGARVFTLERQEALFQLARVVLSRKFGTIRCFLRDGYRGLPVYGPFERILVTAGANEVPAALLEQLAVDGKMVIPVGGERHTMLRITRRGEDAYAEEEFGSFRFVPFREGLVTAREVKAKG